MSSKKYSFPISNRVITTFPKPYNYNLSPYDQTDFSLKTYKLCSENLQNGATNILKVCKIIIIGDASVGKTCIVNRFCKKLFDTKYKCTIGVDFEVETFTILNNTYNLQIWDTAGQERFKSIAQSYYRGAHVIILTFDLNNLKSLENCKIWLKEALNATVDPLIFLVGTKKDLLKKYALKNVELSAGNLAMDLKAEYWSVSSKTGENITDLFFRIAALEFDRSMIKEMEYQRNNQIEFGSDLISFKKNRKKVKEDKCFGKSNNNCKTY